MDPQLLAACVTAAGFARSDGYSPKETALYAISLYKEVMIQVGIYNDKRPDVNRPA